MDYEDKLDIIDKDIAPKNADELFLGMYLAFFVDFYRDDPDVEVMHGGAEKVLEYWRNKYHEEIMTLGGKHEENNDDHGQPGLG